MSIGYVYDPQEIRSDDIEAVRDAFDSDPKAMRHAYDALMDREDELSIRIRRAIKELLWGEKP